MKVKEPSETRPVGTDRTVESRPAAQPPATTSDRVSTDESARLEAATAAARQQLGSGRAARLEAIEAQLRAGTLAPDSKRIAQKILEEAELAAMLQTLLSR